MRYLKQNRLWQGFLLLFVLHQVLEKGLAIRLPFIDNYLDDLLCMPILLGALLGEQYDLVGRQALNWVQIVITFLIVAIVFEFFLPGVSVKYTADVWDVVCYGIGSLVFGGGMNKVK